MGLSPLLLLKRLLVDVLRCGGAGEASCRQTFAYETEEAGETVATMLTRLNEREKLCDASGNAAKPIRWECSCMQRRCGSCAMRINGKPRLACDARLSEYRDRILLEPLRKFPLVADLVVDRSIMQKNLTDMRVWLEGSSEDGAQGVDISYEASRCLQCGICLEICPNYAGGEGFTGLAGAVPMSRLLAEAGKEERKELAKAYRSMVFEGCGKSLSCRNACPAGIDADGMLARSNAVAVWKRRVKESK